MLDESVLRNYSQVVTTFAGKKIGYKTLPEHRCFLEAFFFEFLQSFNIPVAYLSRVDTSTISLINHEEFQFGIRVSNNVDWRISEVLHLPVWSPYPLPVLEYFTIKDQKIRLAPHHLIAANLASAEEVKALNRLASKINVLLKGFFERRESQLLAFNCLFGKTPERIVLTGNFFPPNMQIQKNELIAGMDGRFYTFHNGKQLKSHIEKIIEIIRS